MGLNIPEETARLRKKMKKFEAKLSAAEKQLSKLDGNESAERLMKTQVRTKLK